MSPSIEARIADLQSRIRSTSHAPRLAPVGTEPHRGEQVRTDRGLGRQGTVQACDGLTVTIAVGGGLHVESIAAFRAGLWRVVR